MITALLFIATLVDEPLKVVEYKELNPTERNIALPYLHAQWKMQVQSSYLTYKSSRVREERSNAKNALDNLKQGKMGFGSSVEITNENLNISQSVSQSISRYLRPISVVGGNSIVASISVRGSARTVETIWLSGFDTAGVYSDTKQIVISGSMYLMKEPREYLNLLNERQRVRHYMPLKPDTFDSIWNEYVRTHPDKIKSDFELIVQATRTKKPVPKLSLPDPTVVRD